VTRKTISTNGPVLACDVCGRTLLRGEHGDVFLHAGVRRMVCELCTARAAHEGWIREGLDDATVRTGAQQRGSRGFFARLRGRRGHEAGPALERVREAAEPPPGWAQDGAAEDVDTVAAPAPAPEPAGVHPHPHPVAAHQPHPAHDPHAPREHRSVHAIPTNAELKMARALDLFNASQHPRTVAGVARSLGAPIVAVRPSPTEGSVVTIAVAWELSWYRFEVDLADEAAGVRLADQGTELDELDPGEGLPNAAADDRGELHLVGQPA
jgi:hypothetical protein